MRSVEFIQEGILGKVGSALGSVGKAAGQQLAKWGLGGEKAQLAAFQKDIQTQEQVKATQDFMFALERDLEGAINAGLVTPPTIPESMSVEDFNALFESTFLREAVSVAQFVKDWALVWAKKNGINVEYNNEAEILRLADAIQAKYKVGSFPKKEGQNLYAGLNAIGSTQAAAGAAAQQQLGGKYGFPKVDGTIVDVSGNDYKFNISTKKWTDESGNEIDNPEAVNILNKLAYDQAKSAIKQFPDPKGDVPTDASSGKTWKPSGAKNNYTYNQADKKWRIGTLTSTKVITDPNIINLLNKAYSEQGALE